MVAWDDFKNFVEEGGGIPVDPAVDPEAEDGDTEVSIFPLSEKDLPIPQDTVPYGLSDEPSYELHKRYLIERYVKSWDGFEHPDVAEYPERMAESFRTSGMAFAEQEGLLLTDEEFRAAEAAGNVADRSIGAPPSEDPSLD